MDYKEFNTQIRKAREPKSFRVNNSWGVYDCYKAIRKHQWFDIGRPLKEHEFYSIIRKVNKLFAQEVAGGGEFTFPSRMGKLEIRRAVPGVSIVEGKLKNTYVIDWGSTVRLWYDDEEAKRKKTLVRFENDIFHVKYNKFTANFENQSFYEFDTNRFLRKALQENVRQGKIDTLYGYQYTIHKHKEGA